VSDFQLLDLMELVKKIVFCFLVFFAFFCIFLGKRKFAGKFFFLLQGGSSRHFLFQIGFYLCVCLLDGLGADYLLWWFFFLLEY